MTPRRVYTVNAGSSSVRLGLYDATVKPPRRVELVHDRLGRVAAVDRLAEFVAATEGGEGAGVVHRVVHGGPDMAVARRIDAVVEQAIRRSVPLAPLHNPRALEWIEAARLVLGSNVAQVAVFDSGFYARLPDVASHYALPADVVARHGIRRLGFHGIAHRAMWEQLCARCPGLSEDGRVISFQLGAGCSVTAVRNGRAIDTSMGFSPTEGLMMATRSGDIDPGLLTFLQRAEGWGPDKTDEVLNHASGLLGVSGLSADMRELLESPEPAAALAVAMFCYRARKYLGAFMTALGGVDAIVFGGGIGENAPQIRARILDGLEGLGVRLDPDANTHAKGDVQSIAVPGGGVDVWVIAVEEDAVLAAEAVKVLDKTSGE